jgi:hypothetical protein
MLARLENDQAKPMPRRPSRKTGWLHTLAAFVSLSACATTGAPGPTFTAAPEPSPGRARLYVFRIDPQPSLSTVELAIDEKAEGHLRHGEYATFELAAGSHRIDLRQRGLAFLSWGWNGQQLRARAGETIYLEVSVRISAQPLPGSGRDLEIAGRDGGAASENVFLQHRGKAQALERLSAATLRIE